MVRLAQLIQGALLTRVARAGIEFRSHYCGQDCSLEYPRILA
jgi:hypothetical protein